MNRDDLAAKIDHTLLDPNSTKDDVEQLCEVAVREGCAAVCVNPDKVKVARNYVGREDELEIACVVGFPLGANKPKVKAQETRLAIEDGATEIDMVMSIGSLLEGNYNYVRDDIQAVVDASGPNSVKVILETGFLKDKQKVKACEIVESAGGEYVKTSTGFGPAGSNLHDVTLLRRSVSDEIGVKAAGGIRWYEDAVASIKAGATRIGASSTLQILKDAPQ